MGTRKEAAGRHPARTALIILGVLILVMVAAKGLHEVAETGLAGLSTGAIYALGAVGLTLVYGILKLVNFAHGDFLTFGAYMAYLVNVTWGLPLAIWRSCSRWPPRRCSASSREDDVGADARASAPGSSSWC